MPGSSRPCGMDEVNAARSELHNLLVKKLIARYGHKKQAPPPQRLVGARNHLIREGGHGALFHPVNHLIQAEVDLFMHNHRKVEAGDLSQLERVVRSATKGARHHRNQAPSPRTTVRPRSATPRSTETFSCRSKVTLRSSGGIPSGRPGAVADAGTSPSRSSQESEHARHQQHQQHPAERAGKGPTTSSSRGPPRPHTAGSVSSSHPKQQKQQLLHNRQQQSGRRGLSSSSKSSRGSRDDDDNGFGSVPSNINNEWLILDTYQQILAEEEQAEADRRAKTVVQRCKHGLDDQIRQNLVKLEEEEREAEAERAQQRRLLAQYVSHQEELKEALKKKHLEEKCVRASQILDNERKREKELQEKKIDEARLLAECKQKVAEEKEAQLLKRKLRAQSLNEMNLENIAKLAAREKQKLVDAEEDKRLMREYEERLDREQAERTAAFNRRLRRYEMIGNKWTESGAGKRQRDKDMAEEKRVLAEAAIKEKDDLEREIRDKEALRVDRLRCLEDNRRLIEEKKARQQAEAIFDAKYAKQYRSEGEEHAATEAARRLTIKRQNQVYAQKLKEQMRATRATLRTVQMTSTEREINGALLRKLQADKELQEKISRRLLQGGGRVGGGGALAAVQDL